MEKQERKADFSTEFSTMRFLTDFRRQITGGRADGRSGAQRRQCLVRKGKYNPAEVRSADFRNAKYSDGASPYPYGGSHFNYGVFTATSFSDHLRRSCPLHFLQGRDKLRLASKKLRQFRIGGRCSQLFSIDYVRTRPHLR